MNPTSKDSAGVDGRRSQSAGETAGSGFPTPIWWAIAAILLVPAGVVAEPIELFESGEQGEHQETPEDSADEDAPDQDQDDIVIERGGAATEAGGSRTIRLDYHEQQNTRVVSAQIGNEQGYLLVDTGASYTSLTPEFARRAGVYPDDDAPTAQVQTAGGVTQTQYGLIGRMSLGNRALTNVTFTLCAECAMFQPGGKQVVGLLGMNVLGRFQFSVDERHRNIELTPHRDTADQSSDIEPWLQLQQLPGRIRVQNRAPRSIQRANLQISCATGGAEGGPTESVRSFRPGDTTTIELDASIAGCVSPRFDVLEGRW